MKTSPDTLKPADKVTVTVYAPDGSRIYQTTNTGFHNIEQAIKATVDKGELTSNPEDCVFEVTNRQTAVAHRYRINAHGHLHLIV